MPPVASDVDFNSKSDTDCHNTVFVVSQDIVATKYRPGACENCGAMTHKKKECTEVQAVYYYFSQIMQMKDLLYELILVPHLFWPIIWLIT